jgi:2-dehydropantoate 2-reductase
MDSLKYAVIGTGALGGFYGGMLARSGKEVHFLFHSDYDWVKQNGLRIDSVTGDFILPKVYAYKETSQMPVCDVVLVCLKTTSNHLLSSLLPPLLHPQTAVILIQNGLGNEDLLAGQLPGCVLAGGLGFICSSKMDPGHVVHMDYGKLTLGSHDGRGEAVLKRVCEDLSAAGVPAEMSDNLKLSRWKKLVWNIPYNGMCVVMNASTKELMSRSETFDLIRDLMREVTGAATACGSPILDGFVQAMLDSTLKMKPYAPSMKLDFDHKRLLEIDAIYSRPIQQARNAGYDMPKTRMLEQQLRFIQGRYADEK